MPFDRKKLLYYDLILDRDILNKIELIYNFKNKTITWQENSISMKLPNCMAKEFFVIKESRPVRNTIPYAEIRASFQQIALLVYCCGGLFLLLLF